MPTITLELEREVSADKFAEVVRVCVYIDAVLAPGMFTRWVPTGILSSTKHAHWPKLNCENLRVQLIQSVGLLWFTV